MVMELAFAAGCQHIITFNAADFKGSQQVGITALSPGISRPCRTSRRWRRTASTDQQIPGRNAALKESVFSDGISAISPGQLLRAGLSLDLALLVVRVRCFLRENLVADFA